MLQQFGKQSQQPPNHLVITRSGSNAGGQGLPSIYWSYTGYDRRLQSRVPERLTDPPINRFDLLPIHRIIYE